MSSASCSPLRQGSRSGTRSRRLGRGQRRGRFAGLTVDDVAGKLRSEDLKRKNVPIQVIVRDGNSLILNTRSAQALEQAGIPRSQWQVDDMTGDADAERRLSDQPEAE